MRLKQKQFVPFMIVLAILSVGVIIFSSFNFTQKQQQVFQENIAKADSMTVMPLLVVGTDDYVRIEEQFGQKQLLVFWASWSEKSRSMLDEIEQFQFEQDSFPVIAALVKDAEESLPEKKEYPDFTYVDGVTLYNHLKVPGFPTYILLDENGTVLTTQIGYEKGVGYDSLKVYLE